MNNAPNNVKNNGSKNRKKLSIKEPKISITAWEVDPRRVLADMKVKQQ